MIDDLIYKQESYEIIGCCYYVYNQLGSGLLEKIYQKALEEVFKEKGIPFQSQFYVPIKINDKVIGKFYLDFMVGNKIVIEIKDGDRFYQREIDQIYSYLRSKELKLGLLVNFTSYGVKFKRILNIR